MNKIIFSVIVIFVISSVALIGQPQYYDSWKDVLAPSEKNDIKGSPYLFENWQSGYIYTIAGDSMYTKQINFNGLSGAFEVKEKGKQIEANKKHHHKVKLTSTNQITIFQNDPEKNDLEYGELIYQGKKMKMIKTFSATIREKTASGYNGSAKEKYYTNSTNYFLVSDAKKSNVKLKPKFFEEYFSDKTLKNYIKKNKLDLKKDQDLVKFLQYAESRM